MIVYLQPNDRTVSKSKDRKLFFMIVRRKVYVWLHFENFFSSLVPILILIWAHRIQKFLYHSFMAILKSTLVPIKSLRSTKKQEKLFILIVSMVIHNMIGYLNIRQSRDPRTRIGWCQHRIKKILKSQNRTAPAPKKSKNIAPIRIDWCAHQAVCGSLIGVSES